LYLQDVNGNPLPVAQINGNHVELRCQFSTGGTAVNVTSPVFAIHEGSLTGSTVAIPIAQVLVPFSKDGAGIGRYRTTFLGGDWLSDGDYVAAMIGTYSGDTITLSGMFSARSAGSVQTYIEMVRSALHDYDGTLYYIENQDFFMFSDGQIYGAIERALNKINDTKPYRYRFTLETVPWASLLIDLAVVYALHQRSILETANSISYNDELSFSINRAPGYTTALQAFKSSLESDLKSIKQDYAFAIAQPIGMGTTRIPYTTARIISFIPMYSGIVGHGIG